MPQKQPPTLNCTLRKVTLAARTSTHPLMVVLAMVWPAVVKVRDPVQVPSPPVGPVLSASGKPHPPGLAWQLLPPVTVGLGEDEGLTVGEGDGDALGELLGVRQVKVKPLA